MPFSFLKTSWHFETTRWAWTLRLTVLSSLLAILVWLGGAWSVPGFYGRIESDFLDSLTRWEVSRSPALQTENRITIIDIDEASLEAFGSWPWPRSLTAQLILQTMEHYQAKALGLDIIFPDSTHAADDLALQKALHLPGVVLAQAFDLNPIGEPPQTGYLAGGQSVSQSTHMPSGVKASGYVANQKSLVEAVQSTDGVKCVGHITPSSSQDGVVRHLAPWIHYQEQRYPMLATTLLRCARGGWRDGSNQMPSTQAFYLEQEQWRVVWPKAITSYTVVSAKEVLTKQVDVSLLKDRYVLLGSSALGIGDRVATPLAPWLPGVMVHAQTLSFILDHPAAFASQDASMPTSLGGDARWVAWLFTMVLGVLICWTLFKSNLAWALMVALLGSLLWLMMAVLAHQSLWSTAWILPWTMVFFMSLLYVPMEWVIVQAKNQMNMRRLGAYLAPTVVKRLLSEGGASNLSPKRATITILFVDVANYTALSETLSPEILSGLTQAILSELTQAVHDQAGTLDKYMGDAVMALWGAPLEQVDHADRAIACALDMQVRITKRNQEWQSQYGLSEEITVRIGINTGEVVVGEMGSAIRRTYTAIGNSVNIAARLQEQAKIWQHPVLLGEACARASVAYEVILLGPLTLRGKHHPEMIYSLAQFGRPQMASLYL